MDAWILYSNGQHPGYSVTRLFGEELFPVCSPEFRKTLSAHPGADEVIRQPLLHDKHWENDWPDWARAVGATVGEFGASMRFGLYKGVIQAAVDGMGMAIGHGEMVAKELASGKLVPPGASLRCFGKRLSPGHERFLCEQSNPCPAEGMASAGMRGVRVVEHLSVFGSPSRAGNRRIPESSGHGASDCRPAAAAVREPLLPVPAWGAGQSSPPRAARDGLCCRAASAIAGSAPVWNPLEAPIAAAAPLARQLLPQPPSPASLPSTRRGCAAAIGPRTRNPLKTSPSPGPPGHRPIRLPRGAGLGSP